MKKIVVVNIVLDSKVQGRDNQKGRKTNKIDCLENLFCHYISSRYHIQRSADSCNSSND